MHPGLGKWFTPSHHNQLVCTLLYPGEDLFELHPFAPVKGIGTITVLAAQRAARKANEGRRTTHGTGFSLQAMKNFRDAQPRHSYWPLACSWVCAFCAAGVLGNCFRIRLKVALALAGCPMAW